MSVLVDDVDDFEPRIAADGHGGWVAVWQRTSFVDGVLVHHIVGARSTVFDGTRPYRSAGRRTT